MATMRMRFRRIELSWIALLLSGVLVGALLVLGITQLGQARRQTSAPVAVAPLTQVSETAGGRLGGLASADTAEDWQIKQGLLARSATVEASGSSLAGGRLGGLASADTANDAQVRQGLSEPTATAAVGVPHWKFVEENQMPEAPKPIVRPNGPR